MIWFMFECMHLFLYLFLVCIYVLYLFYLCLYFLILFLKVKHIYTYYDNCFYFMFFLFMFFCDFAMCFNWCFYMCAYAFFLNFVLHYLFFFITCYFACFFCLCNFILVLCVWCSTMSYHIVFFSILMLYYVISYSFFQYYNYVFFVWGWTSINTWSWDDLRTSWEVVWLSSWSIGHLRGISGHSRKHLEIPGWIMIFRQKSYRPGRTLEKKIGWNSTPATKVKHVGNEVDFGWTDFKS